MLSYPSLNSSVIVLLVIFLVNSKQLLEEEGYLLPTWARKITCRWMLQSPSGEGTLRCLREGDDGEVSCSGTCVGESPPDPLGGDHSKREEVWMNTAIYSHVLLRMHIMEVKGCNTSKLCSELMLVTDNLPLYAEATESYSMFDNPVNEETSITVTLMLIYSLPLKAVLE